MNIKSHGVLHFKDWANSYIPNIVKEIYLDRVYQPFMSGKVDGVFLDIGSNIALWSLYASPFANQIYAFEPAKETYEIGLKNITDNNIKNVKVIQKAVSNKDGKTTFYHSSNTTMNSLNPAVNHLPELAEEVETISLDTFVKNEKIEHIDFMKLDVEGTEDIVLTSEGFKNIVPILDAFTYEWHSWANASPSVINDGLKNLGFVVKQIPNEATLFGATKA